MSTNDSKNWRVRQNVVAPLTVNLLTALILFLCVVIFKKPLYDYFLKTEPIKEYPLYCVAESYTNQEGFVTSDLYIINLTKDDLNQGQLLTFVKAAVSEEDLDLSKPNIELKWKKTFRPGRITDVVEDKEFNKGKGKIQIITPTEDGEPWAIRVKEIFSKAVLRVAVYSDYERKAVTRASKYHVPFEIDYPGE